jgi:SAM-dependent methyltransferase
VGVEDDGVDREQRLVFGEVADVYDRVRPEYPPEVIAGIGEILGVAPGARLLEVGCGTGKATALMAVAGYRVLGLEPSEEMAAVARRNLADFPDVTVETVSFEEWRVERARFDVVTAAQAWHWVRPEIGLPRAHDALRPGGGLAVFWNWEVGPPPEIRRGLDHAYARLAPSLVTEPLKRRLGDVMARQLEESPLFGSLTTREYRWHATYTTADYVALMTTHSNHRALADVERERLHAAIGGVIDAHGGTVEIEYKTGLFVVPRA